MHAVRRAPDDADAQTIRRPGLKRLRHVSRRLSCDQSRAVRLCNDPPLGIQRQADCSRRPTEHALRRQAH